MFRTETQIKSDIDDEKEDEDYMSPEQYHIRLRQIATISYDSVTELNNAKKEAESLRNKMIKQGDKEEIKEFENLFNQIKLRKSIKAGKVRGEELASKGIIDINDIESFIQRMLKRKYKDPDDIENDNKKLNQLVKRFKEEQGSAAKEQIDDISFLFDQLRRKITNYDYSTSSR